MSEATIEVSEGRTIIWCGAWSLSNNALLFCSTHHVGKLSDTELDELYAVLKAREELKAVPERIQKFVVSLGEEEGD